MQERTSTKEELAAVINQGITKNVPLKNFLLYLFSPGNLEARYFSAPGATTNNHHSYPGGLAFHSIEAAKLGREICLHYQSLGMTVDEELVIAGILLHDLGKVWAYEVKGKTEDGSSWIIDKTPQERLLHHIPTGTIYVNENINDYNKSVKATTDGSFLSEELRTKLLHIILSHHGRKSWSSPVTPQFVEAYVVHIVEFMDGVIEKFSKGVIPQSLYDH